MKKRKTIPAQDGFRMPGEFEKHRGCVMIWPVRPGSWPHGAKEAQRTFAVIARAIAESEQVWMLAGANDIAEAEKYLPGTRTSRSLRSGQMMPGPGMWDLPVW